MNQVVFILGGNLGDRLRLIEGSVELMVSHFGPITRQSSIFETAAWGGKSNGNYLNQVLVFNTSFFPEEILDVILEIELKMGRTRGEKWGDRTMDIDILYFGNEKFQSERLTIPHPFLQERRFVLEPLAEILPDFIHPILNKSNRELLENCLDKSSVKIYT
ncbi:2-amino-4-hydroxy-6-hydroxymethyldihydropteridine diphosphokinase [Aquiflexum gelatinilyticum]|uniref:2-amino-4-hydroxy-6- hydroxymethyldihydropteridine diphosphokinase n=1 Tax=Aquiflexum gelatinilyticum TaxID=2961943 RepID=UPI0021687A7B|nr:2-amino-4-hydroxy-6-hydroxymethyldihydropteridine diphosphokinase [Aquiflexum gelatinilyticum]MCS4436500.1 2-amino-4-hydroxy-6-hydroxymethyldihydropteridine diphosphokinase [Aquiflexum gelatinilyticum]